MISTFLIRDRPTRHFAVGYDPRGRPVSRTAPRRVWRYPGTARVGSAQVVGVGQILVVLVAIAG